MILVDRALARRKREGKPVRVAMVGAGFMGRGIALQFKKICDDTVEAVGGIVDGAVGDFTGGTWIIRERGRSSRR